MRKLKIQPPAPLQLSINLIIPLLLRRQRIPNAGLLLVPPDIITFRKQEQGDTQDVDDNQIGIAPVVERLIISAVDEVRADVAELHGHVVEGCGDRAGADVVGVFGCPLER